VSEGEFVFRGDLTETPVPEMLATIHRYGVPGVMEVVRGDETSRLCFVDGDVIFATSSNREQSLGDYLLREGRITKAQYRVSSDELRRSPGKRHGTILVQMGFLRADELGEAVRDQIQAILWGLFNWHDGQVTFRIGRFRDDEVYKIKIPTARAVVAGCKSIVDGKAVTARLGGRSVVFHPMPLPKHLEDLRLEVPEQELLGMVDGKRPLVQLCEEGPMSPGLNARVLYAFSALQLIDRDRSKESGIRIHVKASDGG
jgi:hypothetical protein